MGVLTMGDETITIEDTKGMGDTFTFSSFDMVNHPPHYNQSGVECIDAISAATGDNFKYYLQGNIMKYLWRFDYKGKAVEDLNKAKWYLDKLIEHVDK
jgi:hypothetical protein